MMTITVDTSVATKWFSEESKLEQEFADQIREQIFEGKLLLICPKIIILELANVLCFSKKLPRDEVLKSLDDLKVLSTQFTNLSSEEFIVDTMIKHGLASYDATFVALAIQNDIPLITADYKHHKKEISKNIIWLKEWKGKL